MGLRLRTEREAQAEQPVETGQVKATEPKPKKPKATKKTK